MPSCFDQLGAAHDRRQHRRVRAGTHDLGRVRDEGHQHARHAALAGLRHRPADDVGVAAVHAVEHADGDHAMAPTGRDGVESMPALHVREPTVAVGRGPSSLAVYRGLLLRELPLGAGRGSARRRQGSAQPDSSNAGAKASGTSPQRSTRGAQPLGQLGESRQIGAAPRAVEPVQDHRPPGRRRLARIGCSGSSPSASGRNHAVETNCHARPRPGDVVAELRVAHVRQLGLDRGAVALDGALGHVAGHPPRAPARRPRDAEIGDVPGDVPPLRALEVDEHQPVARPHVVVRAGVVRRQRGGRLAVEPAGHLAQFAQRMRRDGHVQVRCSAPRAGAPLRRPWPTSAIR